MTPFRYFAILIAAFSAIYCGVLAVSFLPQFADHSDRVNTGLSASSLYVTEPKYLVFSLSHLAAPGPRVIIVGSSNVVQGLRPQLLEPLLGIPVHSIAVSGSKIPQMTQIITEAFDHIPPAAWPETTFVLGLSFPGARWDVLAVKGGRFDLDVEKLRYGLYSVTEPGGNVQPRLPPPAMRVANIALRPILLVSKGYNSVVRPQMARLHGLLNWMVAGEQQLIPDDDEARDRMELTQDERAKLLSINHSLGRHPVSDEVANQALVDMAKMISDHGSRLILLDLPMPPWIKALRSDDADYHRRLSALVPTLTAFPNVAVVSMADGFSDDDFYDDAHPRPKVTKRWAQRAASLIAPKLPRMSDLSSDGPFSHGSESPRRGAP